MALNISSQLSPSVMLLRSALLLAAALGLLTAANAQGTRADYENAESLRARTRGKFREFDINLGVSKDGSRVWFRIDGLAGARTYYSCDSRTGERVPAFDHERVAQALTAELGHPVAADFLPIKQVHLADSGVVTIQLEDKGKTLYATIEEQAVRILDSLENSPFVLEARPHDVRLRSGEKGSEVHVTFFNKTAAPVTLYWLDSKRKRKSYGEIAAGESLRQHTFVGHAWLVVGEDGKSLCGFIAEQGFTVAEITGAVEGTNRARRERGKSSSADRRAKDEASGIPRRKVSVRDHNVFIVDEESGAETQVTSDGVEGDGYGGGVMWSPDRRYFVVRRRVAGEHREVHYVESSPRDQLQPKLHSYGYAKPGDALDTSSPHLFDAVSMRRVEIDNALFSNPWSIRNQRWAPDSSRFFFVYNQRGHQALRLISVDAASGEARAIIDENNETFIDYSNKQYLHWVEDEEEAIWMSERDGWNHLYLVDTRTGAVKNQITTGNWVVRGIEDVDDERRVIHFRAMAIHPDQDPYHVHFARINYDGTGLTLLTDGDGTHTIKNLPGGVFYTDKYSRVDLPPVHELRLTADGSLVCELGRADWTQLKDAGWVAPERFVAKGRDGTTDIWGLILRPTNFDPQVKYPVIEAIYAGPHGAHVPKSFRPYLRNQSLAEIGFIVVQIDGMGTNWRSKAFHDVCWKNIGDAGFPDRKLWIQSAAREVEPAMDVTRVGIYGGSAGGQNAMRALIDHHDLYDVACADCGCHDNRMDKVWWNEAWMGYPIDESYSESSNVDQAHKLQGHLLLTVGEADRNVDPASTMQVVDALIKADKDFDLIVFPSGGHGSGGGKYGTRRMRDFFVRHLHGVEPRRE